MSDNPLTDENQTANNEDLEHAKKEDCDDRFSPANWKTEGLNLRGRDNNNWGK